MSSSSLRRSARSRSHTNRTGREWCGAGAVSAAPMAARIAGSCTGMSAKARTDRRSSTASLRPAAIASAVPIRNRSSSTGRTRSRAVEPSSAPTSPRTTATGTPQSLPFTRSAAAAISSATATSVIASSFPYSSIRPA